MQSHSSKIIGLLVGSFLLFSISCKPKEASSSGDVIETPVFESEEFVTFYEKFGTDTAFQMEHIVFPLEGLRPMKDSTDVVPDDFRWERETWVKHKPYDDADGTFIRSFKSHSNNIVSELIQNETGEVTMERRFGKLSSGWHLIYYRELGMY
jgi:hypothetical protein